MIAGVVRAILARDLGVGRSLHTLEPLHVLERREDEVLAEHFTEVGDAVVSTVETVRFRRPDRVDFRLVRGPVQHVVERFELRQVEGVTELEYRGELGSDLWRWAVAGVVSS